MEKVLDSFMNEEQNMFTEFFHKKTKNKLVNREDYLQLISEKNKIYEESPSIREFIEDEIPMNFGHEEVEKFYQLISIYEKIHLLELKEAFKLGAKEVYIFFEEQDMLNI